MVVSLARLRLTKCTRVDVFVEVSPKEASTNKKAKPEQPAVKRSGKGSSRQQDADGRDGVKPKESRDLSRKSAAEDSEDAAIKRVLEQMDEARRKKMYRGLKGLANELLLVLDSSKSTYISLVGRCVHGR